MFVQTFAADNTASDLAMYLPTAFSVLLQTGEIEDPSCTYLLIRDHDEVVAYALVRAGSSSSHVHGDPQTELQRFYVDQRYHGIGLAHEMMQACVESAKASGARTFWLGVWERNTRAIRFYEKCGFATVGTQHFRLGRDLQTDRVMALQF